MNDSHPTSSHDHFFRRTFQVVGHTRSLLKCYLPSAILRSLRLETPEPARETFLSPGEHEKRLDLLYTARFHDGTPVLIYLLLEHKSYIDRHIALQLLGYVLRIQEWRKSNGLPPCVVIPIVAIFRLLREWAKNDSQKEALKDIFHYLSKVFNAQRLSWFDHAIRTGLQIESETQMPTIYEVLIEPRLEQAVQEGFERGIQEGIEKGIEQGIERGIERGIEQGIARGFERGIQQGVEKGLEKGLEKGEVIGRIITLQEVLRQPVDSKEQLLQLSHDELQSRAQQLQRMLTGEPR